jgi:hypothetical protein
MHPIPVGKYPLRVYIDGYTDREKMVELYSLIIICIPHEQLVSYRLIISILLKEDGCILPDTPCHCKHSHLWLRNDDKCGARKAVLYPSNQIFVYQVTNRLFCRTQVSMVVRQDANEG